MRLSLSLLLVMGLSACGVKGSAKVGELDDGDRTSLCEETLAGYPEGVTDCGDGLTVEASTQAECEAELAEYAGCDLLVSEFRDCSDVVAADPCNGFADDACAPVLACYTE